MHQNSNVRKFGKDSSISCARLVAMCFIVTCHMMQMDGFALCIRGGYIEWAFWFNIGVQMFLFISGFLYGKKEDIEIVRFYKKNLSKLLVNYYVFILVMFTVMYGSPLVDLNISDVVDGLTLTGTPPGLGHLWFVPTILFCYLLTPLLAEMVRKISLDNVRWVGESLALLTVIHLIVKYHFTRFTPAWVNCFVLGMIYSKAEVDKGKRNIFHILILILCIVIIPIQFRIDYWPHRELPNFIVSSYNHFTSYGHVALGIGVVIIIRYIYRKLMGIENVNLLLSWSDKYSYDVFLTHHVFVQSPFACVIFIQNRWIALPLEIVLTIVSAMVLNVTSEIVRKCGRSAVGGLQRTVLRSKTDAMRSERTDI